MSTIAPESPGPSDDSPWMDLGGPGLGPPPGAPPAPGLPGQPAPPEDDLADLTFSIDDFDDPSFNQGVPGGDGGFAGGHVGGAALKNPIGLGL